MNILIDTNIILDVLFKRESFFADSFSIFEFAEQRKVTGWITASSMTDIFYLAAKKFKNITTVYSAMNDLAVVFSIASVSETIVTGALTLHWNDFEDAVQYLAAKEKEVDYIITRNKQDYESATIPCLNPTEFIVLFNERF
jgi:predicted nucleic acid-binding protein